MKSALFALAATFALATGAYAAPVTSPAAHGAASSTMHTAAPAPALRTTANTSIAANTSASGELSCHTHHRAGQSCMCLKAPSRRGAAELKSGHNMCVVPPAHNHA